MLSLNLWGPSGWHLIHVIMMCSPHELNSEQQDEMMQFLVLLGKHLPCPRCRHHFLLFLERNMNRESVRTRDSLVRLMNDAHNEVNRQNNKRIFTLREHYAWITTTPHQRRMAGVSHLCTIFAIVFVLCVAAKKIAGKKSTRDDLAVLGRYPTKCPSTY